MSAATKSAEGIDQAGEDRLAKSGLLSQDCLTQRAAELQARLDAGLPAYDDDPEGEGPERPETVIRDEQHFRAQLAAAPGDNFGDPPTPWDYELLKHVQREYPQKAREVGGFLLGCLLSARRNLRGTKESPPEKQRAIAECALRNAQLAADCAQIRISLADVKGLPAKFTDEDDLIDLIDEARELLAEEMDCNLDEVATEDIVDHVVAKAKRAVAVEAAADKLRIQEEAKRAFKAEQSVSLELPGTALLSELLTRTQTPTKHRIDGLLPASGRVILAAQYKAGKTLTSCNLVRCLVNGDLFLGKYSVEPVQGRVTVLDTEMDLNMLRSWLVDQGINRPDRVAIEALRGRVGALNILDPSGSRNWADRLRALETEVLIVDCLRPILDEFGLNENTGVGAVLVALDKLVAAAGISELIVVHHMGHNGERSRGDSRLRDWPDVEWRLMREDVDDSASRRFFSAYGRDVEVAEAALDFNRVTRHLRVAGGSRQEARADAVMDQLIEILTEAPGLIGKEIEQAWTARGVPQKVGRAAVKRAIEQGVVIKKPKGMAHQHYLSGAETYPAAMPGAGS